MAVSVVAFGLLLVTSVSHAQVDCGTPGECEALARDWLDNVYEPDMRALLEGYVQKDWEYNTDITDENAAESSAAFETKAAYEKQAWLDYVTQFDQSTFADQDIARRLDLMDNIDVSALEEDRLVAYNEIVNGMMGVYGSGKVCPYENQECDPETEGMNLEPEIEEQMAENRDYDQLAYYWQKWRDATGSVYRSDYQSYVDIENEAAVANEFADASEMWLDAYTADLDPDVDDFRADLEALWQDMKPLYEKLHGYIRYKLRQTEWGDRFGETDPIPAHLSGNMWAQSWENIYNLVAPYPNAPNPLDEVDEQLVTQNYTERDVFELSNDFYLSMGLDDMQMCYDTQCANENTPVNKACYADNPLITKPDWDVVCHASAWDMYNVAQDDYRIKMCTVVNLGNVETVHHEMGHIQYFIQYVNLPLQFRDGANPGFHEAIGDLMAMAVITPEHMYSVGLLSEIPTSEEADINFLMDKALSKVMFLPFGYTIDQYRWALFDGTISKEQMNQGWWDLRNKYQGLAPPVPRSEEDFDAGAKYHVPSSVPYIRYFAAYVLEFMFYKDLCEVSGQYEPGNPEKPLHRCDYSAGALAPLAGDKLRTILQYGSSKPWPQILEEFTGSNKMSADALLEYFAPLETWLDQEIAAYNIPIGWTTN